MSETATITIPVYRSREGKRSCNGDLLGQECPFLGVNTKLNRWRCNWTGTILLSDRNNHLIPCSGCPISQEVKP